MKRLIFALLAVLGLPLFAELPKSIILESGKVRLRLDAAKRWNINRIEWEDRQFGVDLSGAHYGMSYRAIGGKHPIGSGHDESGIGEKAVSVKFYVDGREVPASKEIKGKKIVMEKVSEIPPFSVKYFLVLENDILSEKTEITTAVPVKTDHIYVFMHPWSIRFTEFHGVKANGSVLNLTLHSDESFPNRAFLPSAAWYDPGSGDGVVTLVQGGSGCGKLMRFLWDRKAYHKDYTCAFWKTEFPAGHKAVFYAETGFFREKDAAQWIPAADRCAAKLQTALTTLSNVE